MEKNTLTILNILAFTSISLAFYFATQISILDIKAAL